jgi:hypothetical protein
MLFRGGNEGFVFLQSGLEGGLLLGKELTMILSAGVRLAKEDGEFLAANFIRGVFNGFEGAHPGEPIAVDVDGGLVEGGHSAQAHPAENRGEQTDDTEARGEFARDRQVTKKVHRAPWIEWLIPVSAQGCGSVSILTI